MPTPFLYAGEAVTPFDESLDAALASDRVELLYVTDRNPVVAPDGTLGFGIRRSESVSIGTAVVTLGPDAGWEALAADAVSTRRDEPILLELSAVDEVIRTPPTPYPYRLVDGRFVLPVALQDRIDADFEVAGDTLRRFLGRTTRKEVFVYVHGVANQFDDALFVGAEYWHFLGREGVPIVYSWPAGKGGLGGYAYDRESSEFTVAHFRDFLLGLASFEEIERIHVIAHSRGTDVATTALRELFAESRAAGVDPKERFRIGHLVLAAPDLDLSVVQQRSSRVAFAVDRLTVYTSKHDSAIGVASLLFGSLTRLGELGDEDLSAEMQAALAIVPNLSIIEYTGENGGEFGHSYYRLNPAVASDLVLLLRFDRAPGAEHGRPLIRRGPNFWEIGDDYLAASGE